MGRKVLIIEDEPDTIFFFSRALERANMQVILAKDREAGIAMARETMPDAIVLDLKIPPEGTAEEGFRVIEALKEQPRTADIPVIIVTAYVSEENKQRARKMDARYFEKPIQEHELIQAVRTV